VMLDIPAYAAVVAGFSSLCDICVVKS